MSGEETKMDEKVDGPPGYTALETHLDGINGVIVRQRLSLVEAMCCYEDSATPVPHLPPYHLPVTTSGHF